MGTGQHPLPTHEHPQHSQLGGASGRTPGSVWGGIWGVERGACSGENLALQEHLPATGGAAALTSRRRERSAAAVVWHAVGAVGAQARVLPTPGGRSSGASAAAARCR